MKRSDWNGLEKTGTNESFFSEEVLLLLQEIFAMFTTDSLIF